MTQNLKFITKISGHTSKGLVIRGHALNGLIKEADFISTLFLSLTGRKPLPKENKILNAILVSALDHGISPATGFIPRVVASSGANILQCMASTILTIGPYHGGAVSDAQKLFAQIYKEALKTKDVDIEGASQIIIKNMLDQKQRIPGFGHPIYKDIDPRTKALFELARKEELSLQYMNIARQVEHTLEQLKDKKLPLNIDGSLAALLLTLGIDEKAGNAIFALSKVAGSIAHIIEEQKTEKWVRRLPEADVEYEA